MLVAPAARRSAVRRAPFLLAFAAAVLVGPSASRAHGDDRPAEVRIADGCGAGATSKLRLRSRDGIIEARFAVEHTRGRVPWRVFLVHEGTVAWRGPVTAGARRGGFELSRHVADLPGADEVTARGYGGGGLTCTA